MLLAVLIASWLTVQAPAIESITVHGNHTTPTADVLAIVGDLAGREPTDALLAEVRLRLERSGRFSGVEVRRRYLFIDDPSRVLIVIVVNEHPAVRDDDLMPGPMRRVMASGMWVPLLGYQEGYGTTYGVRLSAVDLIGTRTRVSAPLTWGGERQAAFEVERTFDGPVVARVAGGGGVTRRVNPAFDVGDRRASLWARVESAPRSWLRVGGGARRAAVRFDERDDTLTTWRADAAIDTRIDPAFPRNAVHVQAGIERLAFSAPAIGEAADGASSHAARRTTVDARGYLGLIGQTVLAVRGQHVASSRALPAYEQALLGGAAALRGWDVGRRYGDNLAAGSVELLVPISTRLSLARTGFKVFADAGAAYAARGSLRDQTWQYGYGVGAFVYATVFTLGIDVGWPVERTRTPEGIRRHTGGANMHLQIALRLGR
ncbi:MAG: BamA/TamA family outer membrane protein [Acidobacteria bacterium]|nr:BamA/TamA family outer membrane protein [Acidobacteriota bacterium]